MNITTSRGENYTTKEEREKVEEKNPKVASTGTSIIPWSRLKDPRIVRVSRAFGGKDRHSKVCTVKGLRDRRVRLSVPTAIQLYDLQERLGLNQPSKVVDWLLNAAKHDIDELPPLQIPQEGNFFQNHGIGALDHWDEESQLGLSRSSTFRNSDDALRVKSKEVATEETTDDQKENWNVRNEIGLSRSSFWNSDDASLRDKSKEVVTEEIATDDHKVNWNKGNEEGKRYVSSHNHHSFFPGLVNNVVPYNSFYRLDPGDFSLGISHGFSSMTQTEDFLNFNFVPNGSQVPQPYFPSHVATSLELDIPKQINHFHHEMLNSNSSQIPSSSSSTPTLYSLDQSMRPLPSQASGGSQSDHNQC